MVMGERPMTIRYLDPPLHEFLPTKEEDIVEIAGELNMSVDELKAVIASLHEFNPMMGHRGCRLAVSFPEIAEMQTEAIVSAAINVWKEDGLHITPDGQTDVENLATVYNGLTSYQQSYIDSDTLATFVKLDGTMKSLVFDNALSQIPSADELTLENKEAVEALRKNYDSLTTTEKTYISKDSYDQLTALEAKIAELEKKAE